MLTGKKKVLTKKNLAGSFGLTVGLYFSNHIL
jgi:hypothetical protein